MSFNIFREAFTQNKGSFSSIVNTYPKKSINLQATIPSQSSSVNINYTQNFYFQPNDFNIVSHISGVIDTAGVYNVKVSETISINGTPTVFLPGFYDISTLESLLSVTVLPPGANSNHTDTGSTTLSFGINSIIAVILGFAISALIDPITIPTNTISPYIVNISVGYQVLNIKCSFTDQANEFGNNYITNIVLAPSGVNTLVSFDKILNKPVRIDYTSNLNFFIYDQNNEPYILQTPLTLFIDIDIYDKYGGWN